MNRNLKIAAIEYQPTWADKNANLTRLHDVIKNIGQDTDLIVLPEMFSTGFITDKDIANNLAERNTETTISDLKNIADDKKVAIAGSFIAKTASKLYNRAFFIEPGGSETFYDKHHLFSMGGENTVYSAGNTDSPIVRYRGWNIKIVVCYDLRFPVWCRNSYDGELYDLLLVVANWPKVRKTAWTTLLSARAIENSCYVCGVNRSGLDPSGVDYGSNSSAITNYKGENVGDFSVVSGTDVLYSELNYEKLQTYRTRFPVWKDADKFFLDLNLK